MKTRRLNSPIRTTNWSDPLLNEYHALALKLATREEIDQIKAMAFKVNELLREFFDKCGVELIDFKLEFGRLSDGTIVLADENQPRYLPFLGQEYPREAR